MSQKLSDSDKNLIVELYRDSKETIMALAERFNTSSSTIRRLLKSNLSNDEHEMLMRGNRKRSTFLSDEDTDDDNPVDELINDEDGDVEFSDFNPELSGSESNLSSGVNRRRRRRVSVDNSVSIDHVVGDASDNNEYKQLELGIDSLSGTNESQDILVDDYNAQVTSLQAMLGEDVVEDVDDFADEDDDLDDLDEDGLEIVSPVTGYSFPKRRVGRSTVQTLPLTDAIIPKICYLVIDQGAELITRPLKTFAELGDIPEEETQEKTLPVFDNHRVAKRFAARNQRICKVPDGKLLEKTAPYLKAKGITRLLIDGQVYRF